MAAPTGTIYNGSELCEGCGRPINPVESMYAYSQPLCPDCRNNKLQKLRKNRMSE